MDGPERPEDPARREVGGYRLVRVLGAGGMGTVHEAIDADDNRVALKLLHPAFSADDAARERLRREVSTLHRVRGPHVARVLDAEADSDEAFVVTELIDGQSLEDSIREHGPMDADELSDLAEGLAAALESIHAVGVMHRDLKPGNVMLTDDGPVVIDFGIAQLADDARLTQTGLVTGTPGYVDPEMMHGKDPGTSGDWWGWAAVLVHAATGRPPFGRGPLDAVLARVETGRTDTEGLPPRVAQVLRRALHPDPVRRMSHATVLRALADHAAGREVTALLDIDDDALPGGDRPGRTSVAPSPPVIPPRVGAPHPGEDLPRATAVMPQQLRAQYPPTQQRPVTAPGADPWAAPVGGAAVAPWEQQHRDLQHSDLQHRDLQHRDLQHRDAQAWDQRRDVQHGQPQHWDPHGPQEQGPARPDDGRDPFGVPSWAVPARSRPGIVAAWWVAFVALGVLRPALVLLALVAVLLVGGTVGSATRALLNRRLRHGLRRSDVPVTTLATPVHVVLAALLVLPGAFVAALAGAILWGLTAATAPMAAVVAAVVAVVTLLCWWTPSSTTARQGVRTLLGVVAPGPRSSWAWILVALAVAAAAFALVAAGGMAPDWAPFGTPPVPQF